MQNKLSTDTAPLKCPSCGSENMTEADYLGQSGNRTGRFSNSSCEYIKPRSLNMGIIDISSDFTPTQLESIKPIDYVCESCGLISKRVDPVEWRKTWHSLTQYKYRPVGDFKGIIGEWNPVCDITILHHSNDRDPLFFEFIEQLKQRGITTRFKDANWTKTSFVNNLLFSGTSHFGSNPFNVWDCRLCILLISQTLLKVLQKNPDGFTHKLKSSLFEEQDKLPRRHHFRQWIVPVGHNIDYEDLEATRLLDEEMLFRKLGDGQAARLADELANHIKKACKHRPEDEKQQQLT